MRAFLVCVLGLGVLAGCGPNPDEAPTDGDAVRERAEQAQTARRRTGAEIQSRVMNRVIRTVYLCNNSERLSVDFDNPRQMATVRDSTTVDGGGAVEHVRWRDLRPWRDRSESATEAAEVVGRVVVPGKPENSFFVTHIEEPPGR